MIKRLILISTLITSVAYGQNYLPMGNNLERKIVGVDTSFRIKLGSPGIWNITDYYTARLNLKVGTTGNQTIAGIKTFSSSPIVPTATTSTQAVNLGQLSSLAPEQPDGVVTQGVVSINDGTYLVTVSTPFEVRFNNVVSTTDIAPDNTLQLLAPDGTYNRIDAIYTNTDGSYGFITGAASNTPTEPVIPSNTIQLALIYRSTNGTNTIVYSGISSYYRTIGGPLYGQATLMNENNVNFYSRIGGTDTGDLAWWVWNGTTATEQSRMWVRDSDANGFLYVRYGATENGGLGYKIARSDDLALKANIASPIFTGTVTMPTPFTLGAVSVLTTGTELNYVDGVTSSIQAQLDNKIPYLSDTTALKAFARGSNTTVSVTELNTAGIFTYAASGQTVNGGTVFTANGGGYWVRQFSGPVFPEWFGAKGDGSTNDAIPINKAIRVYSDRIDIAFKNKTYVTGKISRLGISNINIIGNNATLLSAVAAGDTTLILGGTRGTSLPVTANITAGSSTLTMSSPNAATLTAGDYIYILSNQNYFTQTDRDYKLGEILQVASVASGTVTTSKPIEFGYVQSGNNLRVYKLSMTSNVKIENLSIVGTDSEDEQVGLYLWHSKGTTINNVNFGKLFVGSQYEGCVNTAITGGYYYENNAEGVGYGIVTSGATRDFTVSGVTGYNNRHLFTTGDIYGVCMNILVTGCSSSMDTRAPFHTHGNAKYVTFSNNIVRNSAGGVNVLSPYSVVTGNTLIGIEGSTPPIYTVEAGGFNIDVTNNTILGSQSFINGVEIGEETSSATFTNEYINASNNRINGMVNGNGIFINAKSHLVSSSDNNIFNYGYTALEIGKADQANVVNNFISTGARNYPAIKVTGNSSVVIESSYGRNAMINNNHIVEAGYGINVSTFDTLRLKNNVVNASAAFRYVITGVTKIDSGSVWLTSAQAAATYLPLTGGSLSSLGSNTLSINTAASGIYTNWSVGGSARGYIGSADQLYAGGTASYFGLTGAGGRGLKLGASDTPILTLETNGTAAFSGSITGTSIVKSGGTSAQFLKADGSVDNNIYLTTDSAHIENQNTYTQVANMNISGTIKVTPSFGSTQFSNTGYNLIQIVNGSNSTAASPTEYGVYQGSNYSTYGYNIVMHGGLSGGWAQYIRPTNQTLVGNVDTYYPSTSGTLANTVDSKDIEITDTTKGYILKSPDGTRWRITVSNAGALIVTSL